MYSWRLSSELKADLEREARRRKVPISTVLDSAVHDWLKNTASNAGDDDEQRRLHEAASGCFGIFAGHDTRRAENARRTVRQRLRRRHAR